MGGSMKYHLLATVSSLALISAASAADLLAYPTKAPPAVIAPSWTGPYVGLNGGVAWHRAKADLEFIFPAGPVRDTESARDTATGATFGGQIGYNWQFDNFVYGLEADLNWVDGDGSATAELIQFVEYSTEMSWLATVRGRVGMLISPPTLLYVTGGLAVGRIRNTTVWSGPVPFSLVDHRTRTGWTVGGGIEHRLAPNWTVKAEALYVDLGRMSESNPLEFISYRGSFRNTAVVGRIGLNRTW
ncbi:MAG: outer membrane beta-barrel protein [Rhizobiales bacterium]|nr:outer membrane beta-barrel protein [Hyphomicrobiales bacterium]